MATAVGEPSGQLDVRARRWAGADVLPRLAVAVALLPLVLAAIHLLLRASDYVPTGDLAATELQVRDIGHHPVLVGLFSRDTWSHPGPLLFYLLAPFYWLTGGSSVGLLLGGLAINGAAIAGTAFIAHRRGGTPLLLCTLLGIGLLVRTFGADRVADPWVCFITVLPLGLMIFLTWSMMCGDRWALPWSVVVASFLAQTHVGFVPIALPLLLVGAVWLVRSNRSEESEESEASDPGSIHGMPRHDVLLAAAIGGVLWIPPLLDLVFSTPSNVGNIVRWFREAEGGVRSPVNGWRLITGQFGLKPEWLIGKLPCAWPTCEAPFTFRAPFPWLLAVVGIAAIALWRRVPASRALIAILGLTMVLAIVAIGRTIGPIIDYRYYWTWIPAMVAFVLTLWAGWVVVAERWPGAERRLLVPTALGGLLVVAAVNLVGAATAGIPHEVDARITRSLLPGVVDALEDLGDGTDGQVVFVYPYGGGQWWARGLMVQLERRGYDVRVDHGTDVLGDHRFADDGPERARLAMLVNDGVLGGLENPNLQVVAQWETPYTEAQMHGDADVPDGAGFDVNGMYGDVGARRVGVFLVLDPDDDAAAG